MQFLDSLNADDQFWDNKHHYRKQTFLGNREADTTDRKRMKNWFNKERRNW